MGSKNTDLDKILQGKGRYPWFTGTTPALIPTEGGTAEAALRHSPLPAGGLFWCACPCTAWPPPWRAGWPRQTPWRCPWRTGWGRACCRCRLWPGATSLPWAAPCASPPRWCRCPARNKTVTGAAGTPAGQRSAALRVCGETLREVKGGRTTCEHGRGFFKEQGRSVLTTHFWHFFLLTLREKSSL